MLRLIIKFWPVLLPLIWFVIWFFAHKQKNKKSKKSKNQILLERKIAFAKALCLSVVIAFILVFYGMLTMEKNVDEHYEPPSLKNGEVIPGKVL